MSGKMVPGGVQCSSIYSKHMGVRILLTARVWVYTHRFTRVYV